MWRNRNVIALVAILVGFTLPVQQGSTNSGTLAGPRFGATRPVSAISSVTIGARVTGTSGGRAAKPQAGCSATVLLALTITYGRHATWSRDTVLVYQPPRGVRVLTATQRTTSRRSSRRRKAKPSVSATRLAVPRPRHGRSTIVLKLSLTVGLVQVDRHHKEIGAQIGGKLQVLEGQHSLAHTTLRLLAAVKCAAGRPPTTGTTGASPTPTSTLVSLASTPTSPPASDTSSASSPTPTSPPASSPTPMAAPTNTALPPSQTPTVTHAPTVTPTFVPGPTNTATAMASSTPSATAMNTATAVPTAIAATVAISNFAFNPTPLTVPAGTTVTWTNNDTVTHTVTAQDHSWDSGPLGPGATYSHTFATAGSVAYYCAIHPFMHGTVIVT